MLSVKRGKGPCPAFPAYRHFCPYEMLLGQLFQNINGRAESSSWIGSDVSLSALILNAVINGAMTLSLNDDCEHDYEHELGAA